MKKKTSTNDPILKKVKELINHINLIDLKTLPLEYPETLSNDEMMFLDIIRDFQDKGKVILNLIEKKKRRYVNRTGRSKGTGNR